MKIHVISTANGQENEGMRNVATHITRCLELEHVVFGSGLKQICSIVACSAHADVTMVFARSNKQVYWLVRFVELLCKNVWLVCVQKPDKEFLELNFNHPLNCNYLSLLDRDIKDVVCKKGRGKHTFFPGINGKKFCPTGPERQKELKAKYGFSSEKILAVHVGHCSEGRGLEDFVELDEDVFERLVVASGMFENADTVQALEEAGIRVLRGYQEHIEEIYQMADVYLFPTKSSEYVISIPLSVMEALSCGTPVVGYESFSNLKEISSVEGAVTYINSAKELNDAVRRQAGQKRERSLLLDEKTWRVVAEGIAHLMEREKQ